VEQEGNRLGEEKMKWLLATSILLNVLLLCRYCRTLAVLADACKTIKKMTEELKEWREDNG
jgi:hypothetical protein